MQIHDSYLVAETDEGLTVIDQHALHERVLYEQFRTRVLAGAVESQRLPRMPETIELESVRGGSIVGARGNAFSVGIRPGRFRREHPDSQQLSGHVAEGESVAADPGNRRDLLAGTDQAPTRRDVLDELLHMMSCKAAIKAGDRLTPEEIESLLTQRHLIDDAHHCPHGRPTRLGPQSQRAGSPVRADGMISSN